MPDVTFYPGQYRNNTGMWMYPSYGVDAPDGNCMQKLGGSPYTNYDIELYDYGISAMIPEGSTIEHVYIGMFSAKNSYVDNALYFLLTHGSDSYGIDSYVAGALPGCSDSGEAEIEITSAGLTCDELRAEYFTTIVRLALGNVSGSRKGVVDAVWIRVVYTEPVSEETCEALTLGVN